MTDSDEVKAEINAMIDLCERMQSSLMQASQDVQQLQAGALLLGIQHSNHNANSISRLAPEVGQQISLDMEVVSQIKSELQYWLARL